MLTSQMHFLFWELWRPRTPTDHPAECKMSKEFSGCCSEVEPCSSWLIRACAFKLSQLNSSFLHHWPCFLWSGGLLSHQQRILPFAMWLVARLRCCRLAHRGTLLYPAVSGFRKVQLILSQCLLILIDGGASGLAPSQPKQRAPARTCSVAQRPRSSHSPASWMSSVWRTSFPFVTLKVNLEMPSGTPQICLKYVTRMHLLNVTD